MLGLLTASAAAYLVAPRTVLTPAPRFGATPAPPLLRCSSPACLFNWGKKATEAPEEEVAAAPSDAEVKRLRAEKLQLQVRRGRTRYGSRSTYAACCGF